MSTTVRMLLAAALLTFATAKFVSPYKATYALPVWAYYGTAVFEVALAYLFLFTSRIKTASAVAIVFSLIGVAVAFFYEGDCG